MPTIITLDVLQVRQELEDSIYFVPADRRFENGVPVGDSPKWTLAVLRPIKCVALAGAWPTDLCCP